MEFAYQQFLLSLFTRGGKNEASKTNVTAIFLIAILFSVGYCYLGFVRMTPTRLDSSFSSQTVDVNFADFNNDSFPVIVDLPLLLVPLLNSYCQS
jgi:hypothetical protein